MQDVERLNNSTLVFESVFLGIVNYSSGTTVGTPARLLIGWSNTLDQTDRKDGLGEHLWL